MAGPAAGGDAPVVVGQDFYINRARVGGRRSAAPDESSLSSGASDATPVPIRGSAAGLTAGSATADLDPAPYFGSGYGPEDAAIEPGIAGSSVGGGSSLSSLSAYDLAPVRSFEDRRRYRERNAMPTIASPGRKSRSGADAGVSSSSSEERFPDVETPLPMPAPPSQGSAGTYEYPRDTLSLSASARDDETTFGEYVAARVGGAVPAKRRACLLAVLGVVLAGLVAVASVAVATTTSGGKGPSKGGGAEEGGALERAAVPQDSGSDGDGDFNLGTVQGGIAFDGENTAPSEDGVQSPPSAALPKEEAVSVLYDADPTDSEQAQAGERSTGEPEEASLGNLFTTQSLAGGGVELIPFDGSAEEPAGAIMTFATAHAVSVESAEAVAGPPTAWPTSGPPTTAADASAAGTATGEPTSWPTDPVSLALPYSLSLGSFVESEKTNMTNALFHLKQPSHLPTPGPTARPTEPPTTVSFVHPRDFTVQCLDEEGR